jgi:uncharacterized membrane protein
MVKSLYAIIVVAWLLILSESFVLFAIIIPATPRIHSVGAFTLLGITKVMLTFLLGIIWFVVIGWLTQSYVNAKIRSMKKD